MPIRRQFRYLYPIDWPQLSAVIRFKRAGGRCEQCGRPHGQHVKHLGNGTWWDEARGTVLSIPYAALIGVKTRANHEEEDPVDPWFEAMADNRRLLPKQESDSRPGTHLLFVIGKDEF